MALNFIAARYMGLLSVILLFIGCVNAQENTFLLPPPPGASGDYSKDLVWPINSFQTISWVCNFSDWTVYIYHNDNVGDGDPVRITSGYNTVSGQQTTSYTWNVTVDTDYVDSPTYWIGLDGGSEGGFQTHYVNITAPQISTTTTTTSTSSTATSSSTSTTRPTNSGTISPPPVPPRSNEGTKIGVGVAVPIAILAISAVSFFFWRRRRMNKKGVTRDGEASAYLDGKQELPLNEKRRYEMEGAQISHELPAFTSDGVGSQQASGQISELYVDDNGVEARHS
ncbi:hypothetical protein L207DRAFT_561566 [Hyaloscypha variabilis F]|uniref:Mid2 domain-containing protein n=1 Tax=Hyaloscypha variabilis (strain UAMH 11265 / GT02V1 / F) TaxID=1149755 RepID=A0A2J6S5Z6_HYAVF|nr:hypothetical protein L207DRAFT_561566 [Hyaloscypha variabilis F]